MPAPATPLPSSAPRRALLAAGVVVVLVAGARVADQLFVADLRAPFDFTQYWAAGRLSAGGENPYDGTKIRAVQRGVGLDDTAIMMWNPPWTLTLVMPFGALGFRAAYAAWVLVHLGLMLAAAELLWRGFGGPPGQRWVAYLLALAFVPTAFLIGGGQITAVVLLGLGGFAAAVRANRPVLAGACAAFAAVKPHLLALFALWLIFEGVRTPFGRRVLLGGVVVGGLACVPPTVVNPSVWADYLHATTSPSSADHHHVSRWTPPLAGWWLRQAVPGRPFWVQWLPLCFAAVGFVVWYVRAFRPSSAPSPAAHIRYLPFLVGASLLAAPYGVWQHDLVLLLVPIFAAAVGPAGRPELRPLALGLGVLVSVNAVSLVMMLNRASSEWYVWFAPCVLLGCAGAAKLAGPAPSRFPSPAGA